MHKLAETKKIEDGTHVEREEKMFSVPITTLKDRVKGSVEINILWSGSPTLLSQEQNAILANRMHTMTRFITSPPMTSKFGIQTKRMQPPFGEVVRSDSDDSHIPESDKCIL
ncbi:hypothetical protein DPMN_095676 [Dreissena polymorpha]|uniref:Uncharacterized protein n=1 Tax=Dreissena polymorpha TaxID=45954 RepID=A0A9D4R336_DREPO|nr:hypothetical protein DPMN_095676 [Dreissena polymorpha]